MTKEDLKDLRDAHVKAIKGVKVSLEKMEDSAKRTRANLDQFEKTLVSLNNMIAREVELELAGDLTPEEEIERKIAFKKRLEKGPGTRWTI